MAEFVHQAGETLNDVDCWTPAPMESYARRAHVAVKGGIVTAVGLVLIPAPVPVGCIVTAYGLSILATEFEGAQDALENGKKSLVGHLERAANALKREDEDGEKEGDKLQEGEGQEQLLSSSSKENGSEPEVGALVVCMPNNNATESGSPTELHEIVLARQSLSDTLVKIMERHSYNVRSVSSYFIRQVLLPALRDLKVPRPPRSEEEVDDNDATATANETTDDENKTHDSTTEDSSAPDASFTDTSESSSHSTEESLKIVVDDDVVAVDVDDLPACNGSMTENQLDKEPADKCLDEMETTPNVAVQVEC